jgi:chemotaxis-related protein WspD
MKSDLPKTNSIPVIPCKLNDCWNHIGVWGNRECGVLKKVIHCRNCNVYSGAAAQLLGAELPDGYLDQWTAHFATEPIVEDKRMRPTLIFRIGAEWLALLPSSLQEIVAGRPIHLIPQRRDNILLGLVNIRGELLICVALDRLLGLGKIEPDKSVEKRTIYPRLVVAGRQGLRFVFPVDEVHGIHQFNSKEWKEVPSTFGKAQTSYMKGMFLWQNKSVGSLDDEVLFEMLDRSLA